MTETLLFELTVFVLAVFVGFEVISKVPSMLHTPLIIDAYRIAPVGVLHAAYSMLPSPSREGEARV